MGLGAKPHGATGVCALMRSIMVALVVIELVNLVKHAMALVTREKPGRRVGMSSRPLANIRPRRKGRSVVGNPGVGSVVS